MGQAPQNAPNLFVDSIICGVIGGVVAYGLSRPMFLWAMLSAVTGPVFILVASQLTPALPEGLPGRDSGAYEFAAFAVAVFIMALIDPFSQ